MTGYEPLGTLKPVAQGIWYVDGAPVQRAFVPLPTRCVVVQLQGGGLWIYAAADLTDGLEAELAALGPVGHIVCPNVDCVDMAQSWAGAYPNARLWDVDTLTPDHAEEAWQGQLHQLVVRVRLGRGEAVFCHRPSRTLFFADLFEVLETRLLPVWARPIVWFSGTDDSGGHLRPTLRWGRKYDDKLALGRDVETIMGWGARGLIPAHGRMVEAHANGQLERAFRKELRPLKWERAFEKKGD